jgi:adenine-specific DNA-methyltransferase
MVPKDAKATEIEQYTHTEKRANNPPVGLVTAQTDKLNGKNVWKFDPHLDPELQWTGKAEGTSFEVDTVSLHVHERVDPLTIVERIKKREKKEQQNLFHFFETKENNPPLREAIEFYKHAQGWSNRFIAGDSMLVMNSLIEKEGLTGKVQMIYIDPPYGIKYGSNFQPFVNKREVKDGKDEDLTQEPEMIKAFRDTWELGIHSYLTYLRNRLLLARDLLNESGSVFVQISDENVHLVRCLMDEVFGKDNYCGQIVYTKTGGLGAKLLSNTFDYLIWYAKDGKKVKFHPLFAEKSFSLGTASTYTWIELPNGTRRGLTREERDDNTKIPKGAKIYKPDNLTSQGNTVLEFSYKGQKYRGGWKTTLAGMGLLAKANRIHTAENSIMYVRYLSDFPYVPLTLNWEDTSTGSFTDLKIYVVQTGTKAVQRCLLMTTDPGELVLDITCGSGTTAFVAEKWGRRWITCDTSRVAITLAKQRLMTAVFDYYELAHLAEGVSSGFKYKTVPHTTLGQIANNEPPQEEILYDQPIIDNKKQRISGPFTVESVPSQRVWSLQELEKSEVIQEPDPTIARSGETQKANDWLDELASAGIRGKGGQKLEFIRLEHMPATKWIHAEGETNDKKSVVISFGPKYAPLEQRQVELAIEEAQSIVPKPALIVFAAFQFDPEAAKDIDNLKWPGVNILKVQMNTDLLTEDLKKNKSSNESFWLVGQPDIELKRSGSKFVVNVKGFDYYNPKTGEIESGDASKIAMWELDTDYDGRSMYPRQVFLVMNPGREQLEKLARNLKGAIDEELIKKYFGTSSLPFETGKNKRVAVKIIDDRGIESVKVIEVKD